MEYGQDVVAKYEAFLGERQSHAPAAAAGSKCMDAVLIWNQKCLPATKSEKRLDSYLSKRVLTR
jgi:hypothetical protein